MSASPDHCENPFFIVGAGRSGSTLLRMILSRHSLICIPPESWFLLPLAQKFSFDRHLDPAEIENACRIITTHRRWPDFDLDADSFSQHIVERQVDSIRSICDVLFGLCMQRAGKPRWGDKTPPYISIVRELLQLYPEARIIYLVRDGRDVTNSFIATRWHGPGAWANSREWVRAVRQFAALDADSTLSDQILRIRYEDLVTDTESVTAKICAFLGVDPEPAMLVWGNDESGIVPDRESHAHKKLARRPRESDLYRWRESGSRGRIFLLESYMRTELESEDYPLRYSARLWMPIQKIIAILAPIGSRLYRSTVWRITRKPDAVEPASG